MRLREREPKLVSFAGKLGVVHQSPQGRQPPSPAASSLYEGGQQAAPHHLQNLLSAGELQAAWRISTRWEPKWNKKTLNGKRQSKKSPMYSHLGRYRGLWVPVACDSVWIFWGHSVTPRASRNGAFCSLEWINFCHSSWHTRWTQECITQRKERQLWTHKTQRYNLVTIYFLFFPPHYWSLNALEYFGWGLM